ncbi:MAG TPA: hypothetical protein PKW08_10400 [Flavobacteriaceae bacterium]|nr:hypothetical protein [Flavobacteriaceae bacterium]MCB9213470.1 hypothetical protein [Alteromonas sp.]HPF12227.1 hypothetical protein [Flavobacteriaceae bacterium]HQU21986.1 hypothetical protein [Flavobacteriaceae bacterium]HQU65885.1 hypothetical protein [Flavobacteriaceae bacterium]
MFSTKQLLGLLCLFGSILSVNAQGCVAIRQFSCTAGNTLENNLVQEGGFQVGMNYRYFKSFRHFRGTEEEPDRVANETEVVNHSNSWDFTLNYGITNRLYAGLTLPFVIYTRSSLYEHGREERHITYSRGLADVRVGIGYWMFDPEKHPKGNLALGTGVKLPTGNYNASDIFYNVGPEGGPETRPVDQSIQPGDGGFGWTVDFQWYQQIVPNFFGYAGGFYLFNPRNVNETRTFRETLSPILQNEAVMSVPDQFSFRGGFSYSFSPTFSGSLGGRYEGVPVEDLIGDSDGFRRPGNVLSVEPGISYMKDNFAINLNLPIAVRRERPQSLTDKETSEITGQFRNGDAAFADYLLNIGISYSFGGKKNHEMETTSDIKIE